jgi:hypothetical protein
LLDTLKFFECLQRVHLEPVVKCNLEDPFSNLERSFRLASKSQIELLKPAETGWMPSSTEGEEKRDPRREATSRMPQILIARHQHPNTGAAIKRAVSSGRFLSQPPTLV